MTDLRQAAMLALEAWDDPMGMKDLCVAMDALRKALAQPEQQAEPCIGKDSRCPCQDGDACHYKDCGGTKALPIAQPAQRPWVELTEQDMPSGEDPMFDHQYFIAGMVYATNLLKEKNT